MHRGIQADAESLGRPAERALDEQVEVIRQAGAGKDEEPPSPGFAGKPGKKVADITPFLEARPLCLTMVEDVRDRARFVGLVHSRHVVLP